MFKKKEKNTPEDSKVVDEAEIKVEETEESSENLSFKEKFGNFVRKTKNGYQKMMVALRKVNVTQFSTAMVIFLFGVIFAIIRYKDDPLLLLALFAFIIAGFILGMRLWKWFTRKYFSRFIYYLTEQKFTRKIIAGGGFSYFEYKDPSKETTKGNLMEPIGIIISSLITLLGIAVTIIGIIRMISPDINVFSPILWGVLALVTPILATPVIPMVWALDDAKVKSWAGKHNTTWTVASRYKKRFNSFISIGAIVTNLREGINAGDIMDEIVTLLGIIGVGALILLISMSFFILFYFATFRDDLRELTTGALTLKTYEIKLIEKKAQFKIEVEEIPEEEVIEEASEEDVFTDDAEEEVSDEITDIPEEDKE